MKLAIFCNSDLFKIETQHPWHGIILAYFDFLNFMNDIYNKIQQNVINGSLINLKNENTQYILHSLFN